jgi:uncharacterized protein YciI
MRGDSVSNPFLQPTDIYTYTLKLRRPAITTEGPTEAEAAIVARHWAYLQDLTSRGILIFAGRTLVSNEESFVSVVFRADSEEKARSVMEGDPGVREGLFRARLFPYQVMLMGALPSEADSPTT